MIFNNNAIDITGQKFNRLTAIKFSHKIPYKNKRGYSHFWEYKCDCGKIVIKRKDSVKKGTTNPKKGCKSCGCLNVDTNRKRRMNDYDFILLRSYNSHCEMAKRRNYRNDLSIEQYAIITSQPCRYCDGMLLRKRKSHDNFERTCLMNSVDRLNDEPFYSIENSVSSCFLCQRMKSDFTEKEFIEQVKKIFIKSGGIL